MAAEHQTRGIVLSGGGARGAYEAGIVAGIVQVLGERERAPFEIFTGTSVGAINATWLAAHADRPDMDVQGLLRQWRTLDLDRHLRIDPLRFLAGPSLGPLLARLRGESNARWGRSVLDPRALEAIVEQELPYARLHRNVRAGTVKALVVAALQIATGRTMMFAELAPGRILRFSSDPSRVGQCEQITAHHVLASAAIPLLFPARRIGEHFYADGGVRFNTPIAPAIRCGARKIVVISLLYEDDGTQSEESPMGARMEASYPSLIFLLGKVLNALLLDPVKYDLQVLERLNEIVRTLEETLEPDEMARMRRVVGEGRGLPYERIETLVFRPSMDIGELASEHTRHIEVRALSTAVFAGAARLRGELESDLLSFILFDGAFAERLIALGRKDALARADEIRGFFEDD